MGLVEQRGFERRKISAHNRCSMASISLLERANKIQKKNLERNSDMYKVIDSVYAMARTIEERLGMKNQELQQRRRQKNQKD